MTGFVLYVLYARGAFEATQKLTLIADDSEGIAVGIACGHSPARDLKGELWRYYDALPVGATASMQRDIIAGRPSELDAWNGAVVRFGAEAGLETPVHRFTYHALLPMERRARGQA